MLLVLHKLIWEKAIAKKRIYSNTYERNQNKDVIIIINTRTKNKSLIRQLSLSDSEDEKNK